MKRKRYMTLKIIGIVIGVSVLSGMAYLHFNPQFGGKLTKELKQSYSRSKQWDGKQFVNTHETTMDIDVADIPSLLYANFTNTEVRAPKAALPMEPFNLNAWETSAADFQFIWFGHSVGLMRIGQKNVLIDPMFGDDTSPVGPVRTRRYTDSTLQIIARLPYIDAVCITHDHYDHLDYDSFKLLLNKVGHYYVPIGVKRHLLRWGVPEARISSFDWWESAKLDALTLTFVPARHFSGRGLFDRSKSLWGGWVFQSASHRIYWSGDGGYDTHFKEIGEKLGPFDYAFVECGQYNEKWHAIHMYPEESVQASIDVQAKVSIPIHWGAFTLSLHPWKDPVERFTEEARARGLHFAMPRLGERIDFAVADRNNLWWEAIE
jgi:L-ascorbate metabolism protein UlaG (beta-lactamase superfamily)